ncbi:Uncharacterised protein [uncultured Eubacterium sp.]|nr:Uncharacterised protein [uncultured Eubacterium sp.]
MGDIMIFDNNLQLKKEFDKLLIDTGNSKVNIATELEISKQQLSNLLNKKNLSFMDMKRILDAIGYDLEIGFKKKEN